MNSFKKQMEAAYLDYVNNFITVEAWAEHYGFSRDFGLALIAEMKAR